MGGPRKAKGDVRSAVLVLLAEEPMHGYQIIREIESRSGGAWKPSAGSVYPTLQLFADEGLVSVEESGGRKVYALTDSGREEAEGAEVPWDDAAAGDGGRISALAKAGIDLASAVGQMRAPAPPSSRNAPSRCSPMHASASTRSSPRTDQVTMSTARVPSGARIRARDTDASCASPHGSSRSSGGTRSCCPRSVWDASRNGRGRAG